MSIYSVREAAQQLGISQARVRKLLAEGRIKGRKVSGVWLVTSLVYKRKRLYWR
jgi:excisionase family DNA binding protein